jgi:aspartate kinase
MALIVQKYGGSSVADTAKIMNVARRVAATAAADAPAGEGRTHQVVVVVSAMGKTTDGLLALAREIAGAPDPREMDMLLATGEQVTIALLAMALQRLGLRARSFTGAQVGIRTDRAHTQARITQITAERARQALDAGEIPVVAGFQGVSEEDEITTLGRGGSDLTAVALAAALKADVCEIYTDVDGVYTADPNVVMEARKLPRVAYDEMLEMASLGAKVLQARSVEFAKKYGVPVHVRSTFKPDPGTLVTKEDDRMEAAVVTGITHDRGQAKISILRVPDRPGIAAQIFGAVGEQNIVVDMIVQNISRDGYTDISFTLPRGDHARAATALAEIARNAGADGIVHDERVAKVSIVGVGMRSHSGVAARMFTALAREGINIQMISTSEIAVSCVIEDKYAELAVRALHDAFALGHVRA